MYGKRTSVTEEMALYTIEESSNSVLRCKVDSLKDLKAIMIMPRINMVFTMESATPSRAFSHPREMVFMMFERSLARR